MRFFLIFFAFSRMKTFSNGVIKLNLT